MLMRKAALLPSEPKLECMSVFYFGYCVINARFNLFSYPREIFHFYHFYFFIIRLRRLGFADHLSLFYKI